MGVYGAFISLRNLHTNEERALELCIPTLQDRILKILASLAPVDIPDWQHLLRSRKLVASIDKSHDSAVHSFLSIGIVLK